MAAKIRMVWPSFWRANSLASSTSCLALTSAGRLRIYPISQRAILRSMTVQTIPAIDEMTAVQQIELMEALWQSMSARHVNAEAPRWHREFLENRERALAYGEDSFITLDELEADLRNDLP